MNSPRLEGEDILNTKQTQETNLLKTPGTLYRIMKHSRRGMIKGIRNKEVNFRSYVRNHIGRLNISSGIIFNSINTVAVDNFQPLKSFNFHLKKI